MLQRIILSLLFISCLSTSSAQTLEVIDLDGYFNVINKKDDTLKVVNFWATWCGPCVKELPHFLELQKELSNEPIKFIFVSLDEKNQQNKVMNFFKKRKMNDNYYLLSAGDPNVWINAIDVAWQGSIPATIIYRNGEKLDFREQYFDKKAELNAYILNHK